jgi:CRP-like cAMP-binding protein
MATTMSTKRQGTGTRVAFLEQVFPSLSADGIEELDRISLPVHFDEGELVAQEGSYASGIYVVRSGLVSIGKHASHGREKRCLRFLAPGEMFGLEAVFLEREPVNVQFAKTIVESDLVFFERSNILGFSKDYPRLFADLCRWLAREVIMLEFKLARDAVESLDRNLALLLIALANKYGEKQQEGTAIDLPVSRQTMAEILGVSVESVMRGLKRFRELDLIATENSQIWVKDFDSLAKRARVNEFYLSIIEETL